MANLIYFCFLIFAHLEVHEIYMQRCLQLALLGEGYVAPNPMVGAVLVYNDRIIGEGYHHKYGEEHAEVNCINSVLTENKHLIALSTLYVSLEPCNHFGKTPPCTNLILKKEIRTVIIGCTDPFEKVNGSGISKLRDEGVKVITGVLEKNAIDLNKRFFTFHQKQRPYIILKWAQSQDLKIAALTTGQTKISNIFSDLLVHKWRASEGAIMAGTNTILKDDPLLTARNWPGTNPLRIISDRFLKIPATAKIFTDENPVIIMNTMKDEVKGSKQWHRVDGKQDMIFETIEELYKRNILSLFVEGGAMLIQSFINAGLWDEARVITNQQLNIGPGIASPLLNNALLVDTKYYMSDRIDTYLNNNNVQ